MTIENGESGASVRAELNSALQQLAGTSPITSVDINGGTIDGAVIGGSSAAAGTFTTVTASGDLTIADKIVHSGDTNTAIRFPAADTVTVETSGAERLRVTSAGNVGIGTTSPAAQLHVAGNTTNIVTLSSSSISGTTMTVGTASSNAIAVGNIVYGVGVAPITKIVSQDSGTAGGAGTYTVSVSQTVASGTMYTGPGAVATIRVANTDTSVVAGQPEGTIEFFGSDANTPGAGVGAYISAISESTSPDSALTFGTRDNTGGGVDANERMRITSAGNVGIGTTSPSEELHIRAAVPTFRLEDSDTSAYTNLVFNTGSFAIDIDPTGAGSSSVFTVDIDASERMRITSTGNVGIGTSSPQSILQLRQDNAAGLGAVLTLSNSNISSATGNSVGIGFSAFSTVAIDNAGYRGATIVGETTAAGNAHSLLFSTSSASAVPTERMRIDASGNVGIGTNSPTNLLDVNADSVRIRTAQTPATSGAAGNQGEIAWDANYIYVCTATNTWKRVAIATW